MLRKATLLAVVAGTLGSHAFAGMIGQNVRITGERPSIGVIEKDIDTTVLVGAGVEIASGFWSIYGIDLSDTNILISVPGTCSQCGGFTSGAFNGLHFNDVDGTIGNITSVVIATNTVEGFGEGRLTFDANNIYVNFQGLDPSTTAILSLNVTTDAVAPEPSAWMLMAGGAAGLIALHRKRRS